MQSQMFKAEDADNFIKCQQDEIAGLTKFDVMDIIISQVYLQEQNC